MTRLTLDQLPLHLQQRVKAMGRERDQWKKPKAPKPTAFGEEFDSALELDFAVYLEGRKVKGLIEEWRYHPLKFRIAKNVTYEPDFLAREHINNFTIYEVKGSWSAKNARDSRTRLQVAAYLYQWFKWVGVTRDKDVWVFETIHANEPEAPME